MIRRAWPQNDKICPHGDEDRENFKGRVMWQLLSEDKHPDPIQMRARTGNCNVVLSDDAKGYVIADPIKLQYIGNLVRDIKKTAWF